MKALRNMRLILLEMERRLVNQQDQVDNHGSDTVGAGYRDKAAIGKCFPYNTGIIASYGPAGSV